MSGVAWPMHTMVLAGPACRLMVFYGIASHELGLEQERGAVVDTAESAQDASRAKNEPMEEVAPLPDGAGAALGADSGS